MSRRRWVTAGVAVVALAGALRATGTDRAAWRLAYPHLPPRVQAVPYQVRALFRPARTPIALPTPAPTAATHARPTPLAPRPAPDAASTATARAATPAAAPGSSLGLSAAEPATRTVPPATPAPPGAASLPAVKHAYQTWNNCGPATVGMALSVLGLDEGQAKAAVRLKPNPDDKNVSLDEMARYAAERGAATALRVDGRIAVLESLVAAGVPTIVETWFEPEPGDEMGHYRVVTGYDSAARTLRVADSYLGPNVALPYEAFDRDWRAFNRAFLAVFPAEREAEVVRLIGPDGTAMWSGAAATAGSEVERAPDAFGWFNLGSSLLAKGDAAGAAAAYDHARALGLPWRMLWYQFGPFEAYGALGRWSDVQSLAEANVANAPDLEESWYWLGRAREANGDAPGAGRSWRRAIELNPLFAAPQQALSALAGSGQGEP